MKRYCLYQILEYVFAQSSRRSTRELLHLFNIIVFNEHHVWCATINRNEIVNIARHSLLEFEFATFFENYSNSRYFSWNSYSKTYSFHWFDFSIVTWIASKIWKIIIIVIFAFNKFELIETFAKIIAITTSNWRLFSFQIDDCFSFFSIKSSKRIVRIAKISLSNRWSMT